MVAFSEEGSRRRILLHDQLTGRRAVVTRADAAEGIGDHALAVAVSGDSNGTRDTEDDRGRRIYHQQTHLTGSGVSRRILNGHRYGVVAFSEEGSRRRILLHDQLTGRRAVVTRADAAEDIGDHALAVAVSGDSDGTRDTEDDRGSEVLDDDKSACDVRRAARIGHPQRHHVGARPKKALKD